MTESGYYEIEGHKGYQPKEKPMSIFEYKLAAEYKTFDGYTAVILGKIDGRLIGYRTLNGCLPIPDWWETSGHNAKGHTLMPPAKVVWINEYPDSETMQRPRVHKTETHAKAAAGPTAIRTAVKYVEEI
jgi:hypothetical protein